jgi:hypothetical protein
MMSHGVEFSHPAQGSIELLVLVVVLMDSR